MDTQNFKIVMGVICKIKDSTFSSDETLIIEQIHELMGVFSLSFKIRYNNLISNTLKDLMNTENQVRTNYFTIVDTCCGDFNPHWGRILALFFITDKFVQLTESKDFIQKETLSIWCCQALKKYFGTFLAVNTWLGIKQFYFEKYGTQV